MNCDLQRFLKDGLYKFPDSSIIQPCAFVSAKASASILASRLWASEFYCYLQYYYKSYLPVSHKSLTFCNSCQLEKSHWLPFMLSNNVFYHPLGMVCNGLGLAASSICGPKY